MVVGSAVGRISRLQKSLSYSPCEDSAQPKVTSETEVERESSWMHDLPFREICSEDAQVADSWSLYYYTLMHYRINCD